jgi:hypothetical protein
MAEFAVVGEDGEMYYVQGDIMGEGDDDDDIEVGAARRRGKRRKGGTIRVRPPSWRQTQVAPGVIAPDQGMVPLPLTGLTNNGTFSLAVQSMTLQGQIQKPFRGERLLVSTVRTGTSAVGRLITQLFVGTDLQQGDVSGFDLEQVGNPQAFGVRLTMKPAQPGVFIRLIVALNVPLAGSDTILTTVTLLGRIIA